MEVKNIIVHGSESIFGCVNEIRRWHIERGFRDVGYHFIIMNSYPRHKMKYNSCSGSIEIGRMLDGDDILEENEVGAHALGYNDKSIGVCLIGKDGQYSSTQIRSLLWLLQDIMKQFNLTPECILGHYETAHGKRQGKTCPNMDMQIIRNSLYESPGLRDNYFV